MSCAKIGLGLLLILMLAGCVSPPPRDVNNICSVFREYPGWYMDAKDVQRRWRVPIAVQMAIIHQESKFNGRARPERTKLLWIIPWTRPSTAYGYTQALRSTWEHYKKSSGGMWSSRDDFGDGVDFIGWYANIAYKKAGISRDDAYSLYLAYHEGIGGYQRKTYLKKKWLMAVAHKVEARARIYQAQLASCEKSFSRKAWYKIW
ncbi:transglycosylase SLT domain-containing protein [Legionella nagasakiensis]|uniref:transglycosylase SLT domain-containing protein n=1 Tax=Legionella nagasakiensis TaxID=535290 RepID=UPI0010569083|nr:transglycosylase SLT domain-containing protein [Legionella nagasakiensis]